MILRDFQNTVMGAARIEVSKGKKTLLVLPTGAGKTVIAAAITNGAVQRGNEVLFLAHRKELIDQASNKLKTFGVNHGVIMANDPREALHHPVQVASIQTLTRREMAFRPRIIIIDEAHRARAKSYEETLQRWPDAAVLGLTATPVRADGKGLGELFQSMVLGPSLSELTDQGYLVPAVSYSKRIDLSGIKTTAGDYNTGQLEQRMNQPVLIGDVVGHWRELASNRLTVGFAITVAHSQALTKEFNAAGIRSEHLDGETPKWRREQILENIATGRTRVVWNVGVLCEGWDCPEVSSIILARPTKSLGLYLQMVGRALRPSEGKSDCLILDHAGSCYSHGLVTDERDWTLDPDEMKRRTKKAQAKREAQVSICPKCAMVRGDEDKCKGCGFFFGVQPKHVDGKLELVKETRGLKPEVIAERRKVYFRLMDIQSKARKKNGEPYAAGWATMQYKNEFGEFPHRGWRQEWQQGVEQLMGSAPAGFDFDKAASA